MLDIILKKSLSLCTSYFASRSCSTVVNKPVLMLETVNNTLCLSMKEPRNCGPMFGTSVISFLKF